MPHPYDAIVAAASGPRYDEIINRHAARTGQDPDLIRAIIGQESGGNQLAVSPKGAQGLMQLMPQTARRFGVTNVNDPEQNIRGGTDYLKFLSDKFGGNPDLMLAGYNAGEGAVERFGNKIPSYAETQAYVPAVKARYRKLTGQNLAAQNPYDVVVKAASPEPGPQVPAKPDTSLTPTEATALPAVPPAAVDPYDAIVNAAAAGGAGLTTNDTLWHFGEPLTKLSTQAQKVLAEAVAEDVRKKDEGQPIAPPSLGYQNQMRAKAGLEPLKFNVPTDENAVAPYYKQETKPFSLGVKAGVTPMEVRPAPFTFAAPSDQEVRASIRSQVADEAAGAQKTWQARPTGMGVPPRFDIEAETTRRFNDYQAEKARALELTQRGPRFARGDEGMGARMGAALSDILQKYAPGLAAIDTAAGPKTDVLRAAARGLGIPVPLREVTPEERLFEPNIESEKALREFIGQNATAFIPYIGAGKLITRLGVVNPVFRDALTFGVVDAAKQLSLTGQIDPKQVGESLLTGGAMGKLAGLDPGLKRRLAAYIAPQLAAGALRGESTGQIVANTIPMALFALLGGKKGKEPDGLVIARHAQFGDVREAPDQSGVPAGKIRVIDADGTDHIIITPSIVRNQRAIPAQQPAPSEVRQPTEAAIPPAENIPLAAAPEGAAAPQLARSVEGEAPKKVEPRVYVSKSDVEQKSSWGEKYWQHKTEGSVLGGQVVNKEDLPSTLYHVTTAADAVNNVGMLIGDPSVRGGLGKGVSAAHQGVSVTTSRADAELIQQELQRAVRIARNDVKDFPQWLRQTAKTDEKTVGLKSGTLSIPANEAIKWFEFSAHGEKNARLMADAYNQYLASRERAGGQQNPLLMGSAETLARVDPKQIQILEIPNQNIPDDALIRKNPIGTDFMNEVMIHSDLPIRNVPEEGAKLNRWQHQKFGLVTESADQIRVSKGKVRVLAEDGTEHVIQRPKGIGVGAVSVEPSLQEQPSRIGEIPARIEEPAAPAIQRETEPATIETKPLPPETPVIQPTEIAERAFPKTLEATGREGGTARVYQVVGDQEAVARANARIAEDREAARTFALESNTKPDTPQGKERVATGLMLADRLSNEAENLPDKVDAAVKHAQALELYTKLSVDLTEAGQTAQAGSLARKYSPLGAPLEVVRIAKAQGMAPKTEDISAVREMAKRQVDLEGRIADIQKQIEEMRVKGTKGISVSRAAQEKLPTLSDRLAKMETEARARLEARKQVVISGGQAGASTIPLDIADYTIIGAAKLARGGLNFASWSKEMLDEFGDAIKPHLNKVYQAAYQKVRDERAAMREESAQRGATKILTRRGIDPTEEAIKNLREERYNLQITKGQLRRDLDRKFNQLESRAKRTTLGTGVEAATSVARDGLLSFHGLFNIMAGMSAKQLADFAAQVPAAGFDIAQVRAAQLFGRAIPRTTAGASLGSLKYTAEYLAKQGARNIAQTMIGEPSEVMPHAWTGPFESPIGNAIVGPMGKLYAGKEALIRSAAYPNERYNQASVLARNDILDGVIKRDQLAARINDYLNGRGAIESARNKQLVESLAPRAADYEIRSRNPTPDGLVTPSGKAKRVRDLIKNPTQLIDSLALQRTDKQVYAEPNVLSTGVEAAKRAIGRVSPAGERLAEAGQAILLPFIKRPANAIQDLLYTYTGVRVPVEAVRNSFERGGPLGIKGKTWSPAERASFNQAVGRGGVGMGGLYALGYMLAGRGMMTSQNDKQHPGALQIGDKYYALNRVPIVGWLLTAGATQRQDGMGAVPSAIARMIAEHPLLRGIKTAQEAAQEGLQVSQGKTQIAAQRFAGKTLGRFVPTPLAATAETMDTQQRDTSGILGPGISRLPFLRQRLPASGIKERGSAFDPFLGPTIPLRHRKMSIRL